VVVLINMELRIEVLDGRYARESKLWVEFRDLGDLSRPFSQIQQFSNCV
jgi:hypothetical protein